MACANGAISMEFEVSRMFGARLHLHFAVIMAAGGIPREFWKRQWDFGALICLEDGVNLSKVKFIIGFLRRACILC